MNTPAVTPKPDHAVTVRRASRGDLSFVAWCNVEASSPAPGFCYWDPLLEGTGTPARAFAEAVFGADAFAWGRVEDFFIVEGGTPLAGGLGSRWTRTTTVRFGWSACRRSRAPSGGRRRH